MRARRWGSGKGEMVYGEWGAECHPSDQLRSTVHNLRQYDFPKVTKVMDIKLTIM